MKNPNFKQDLANEVKREVLMELNLTASHDRHLIDSIKRDVLQGLGHSALDHSNRVLVETIKSEVLAEISQDMGLPEGGHYKHHPQPGHRVLVETVKQEVLGQIQAEQEHYQGEAQENEEGLGRQSYGNIDPALVQQVKRSVMAEINTPYYR